MAVELPRYVAIQSKATGKYLCYIPEAEGEVGRRFQFSEENITNPYVKFEIHPSKTGDGSLAHFRSYYGSNKYLAVVNHDSHCNLDAVDQEEEDHSKATCTLFRATSYVHKPSMKFGTTIFGPSYVQESSKDEEDDDGGVQIRLMHANLGRYASVLSSKDHGDNDKTQNHLVGFAYVNLKSHDQDAHVEESAYDDVFKVVNYNNIVKLPEHVTFKGDNLNYLRAKKLDGLNYLQFKGTDIGNSRVGDTITTMSNGQIGIYNNYWGQYWINAGNWVRAESRTINTYALFQPIQISDNIVALKSLRNNYFCKRLDADNKTGALNAGTSSMEVYARLQVEEHVVKREIFDINYRLQDARVYDQVPFVCAEQEAVNNSSHATKMTLDLSHKETRSKCWSNSITVKAGVKATAKAGIPVIAEAKVVASAEVANTFTWGHSNETTETITSTYTATVDPNKKVKVKQVATQGRCDVPFSYTQRDTLYTGQVVVYYKNDGLYTGANAYSFHIETTEGDA